MRYAFANASATRNAAAFAVGSGFARCQRLVARDWLAHAERWKRRRRWARRIKRTEKMTLSAVSSWR